jgi:hypothetical protein
MMRRALPFLLLSLALLPAASADAAVSRKKAIWGPVEFESQSQFPVYKDLGAGIYQTTLKWDEVAVFKPMDASDIEDPGYDWPAEIDSAVSEGKRYGIDIALTVTGAPEWANGGKPPRYGPTKPADFAAFVAAAAKRYPSVHLWSIWDGPSQKANFRSASATQYARLLDGAYAKLKSASKLNKVIGGNSSVSKPDRWISKLKLPNGKAPRLDLYGHDLSSAKRPTSAGLKTLESEVAAAFGKGHKLYLSPVSLPTTKTEGPYAFHVSEATQAAWLTSAFKLTRKDASVYTLGYRGLFDDSTDPNVARGLLNTLAEKKPAYAAFKRG